MCVVSVMEPSEAKEGLRVRYTPVTSGAIPNVINHCGVVTKTDIIGDNGVWVEFDSGPTYYCNYINLTVLDTGVPSPIITETRRYIKEGDYGIFRVVNVSHVKGTVGLLVIPFPFGSYTAEQLREAAHTLTEIAEVLEENKS